MDDDNHNLSKAVAAQVQEWETVVCLSNRVLLIGEDRLSLLLADGIEKTVSKHAWAVPFGILLSSAGALTTATFRDFAGLKAAAWQAMFLMTAGLSLIWLVYALLNRKQFGREQFLKMIKAAGTNLNASSHAEAPALNGSPITVTHPQAMAILQCRQCGATLPFQADGVTICPRCKSIN